MYYYLVKFAIKYIPFILLAYCVCAKSSRVEARRYLRNVEFESQRVIRSCFHS
jgi:hypothetical protein